MRKGEAHVVGRVAVAVAVGVSEDGGEVAMLSFTARVKRKGAAVSSVGSGAGMGWISSCCCYERKGGGVGTFRDEVVQQPALLPAGGAHMAQMEAARPASG